MEINNIGILNIQKASTEVLSQCQELSNIGFLIGTDDAFEQLQPCRITNVAMTLKVPADLPLVFQDEDLTLDDDYLAGLPGKTVFVVNGDCLIQSENLALLQDKIQRLVVNGNSYCPSSLKGLLSTLGQFNGRLVAYKNGSTFFKEPLHLTQAISSRLPKSISTNRLRAFDPDLLASVESFVSIEVLDSCWLEKGLFTAWDKKLHLNLSADLQCLQAPVRYYNSSETLSIQDLSALTETSLAVDGTLTLTGKDFIAPKHISTISCSLLRASKTVLEGIKPLLMPNTRVESLESNKRLNQGKMILTASQLTDQEHPLRIKNHANLIVDKSVTPEMIKTGIMQISNFGVIKAPEELLPALMEKTIKNFGKIKAIEKTEKEEQIAYAYENLGYLAL